MGNFIGVGSAQQPANDTKLTEKEGGHSSITNGSLKEQSIKTLLDMAADSCDDMRQGPLMFYVNQNRGLLRSQLCCILEELCPRVYSSSEDPAGQKKALRCLAVLGIVFPKRTLAFLAKKMDETWKDKTIVFHTIKILQVIVNSNGFPVVWSASSGLEALNYRQGLLTKLLVIVAICNTLAIRVTALELLGQVDSMIHEEILDLWLGRITLLQKYLKKGADTFKQKAWENMLLLFLEDTVFQISDELWVNYFVQSLVLQLSYCSPSEKSFLYKCWGAAMKASRGTLIQPSLWRIVQEISFHESEEREGLAYGLGICSVNHTTEALSILDEYQCYIEHFLMESTEVPVYKEEMKSLLLLGYYFVALLAPREIISCIMRSYIFQSILQNYPHCLKDTMVKSAFIGSVILLCQAIIETDTIFSLRNRIEVFNYLKDILQETPTSYCEVENCQRATKAITLLWNCHGIEEIERFEVMELCISSVMKFPPWDILEKEEMPADVPVSQNHYHRTFETAYDIIKILIEWHMDQENVHTMIKSLKNWIVSPQIYERERATRALAQLLQIYRTRATTEKQQSIANVGHMIGLVLPACVEKQAALCIWGNVAVVWLLNVESLFNTGITSTTFIKIWEEEKQCLPNVRIIKTGMLIIKHLPSEELMPFFHTSLDGMLQAESSSEAIVDVLKMVLQYRAVELQNRVEMLIYSMYNIMYSSDTVIVKRAMKSIIAALVHVEPRKTVNTLLTLTCPDMRIHQFSEQELNEIPTSEENTIMYLSMSEELDETEHLEGTSNIPCYRSSSKVYTDPGDITCFTRARLLSLHHTNLVLDLQRQRYQQAQTDVCVQPDGYCLTIQDVLLQHSELLPEIRGLWISLAADYTVFPKVLDILLTKIPQQKPQRNRPAASLPNAVGCIATVLWDFIAILERKELLKGKEDAIFFHCFLSIPECSTQQSQDNINVWCRNSSPCSVAIQALQNILRLAECEQHLFESMEADHGWDLLQDALEQHKGFAALGRATRNCAPGVFPRKVVPNFLPSLFSQKEACRLSCAAFFAEFLASPHIVTDEKTVMKEVYNAMKWLLNDKNDTIKMYSMRGLVNAIHTLPKMIEKEKENVLDIYLRCLTDQCSSNIRREATSGILKLLPYLSSMKTSTAIKTALLARSYFSDENPCVRQNALEIFGQLHRFFYCRKSIFSDQVEKSLAHLLIHLQDGDPEVAKTSKATLSKCARYLRYKPVKELILSFLHNEESNSLTAFLKEVSKLLAFLWRMKNRKKIKTEKLPSMNLFKSTNENKNEHEYNETSQCPEVFPVASILSFCFDCLEVLYVYTKPLCGKVQFKIKQIVLKYVFPIMNLITMLQISKAAK